MDGAGGHYPCCNGGAGARGCCPAPHLPSFPTRADGSVDSERRIAYDGDVLIIRAPPAAAMPAASAASAAPASTPASPQRGLEPTPCPPAQLEPSTYARVGAPVPRTGDEIMVCGQLYHTGAPVILWGDVGGYDHYRVERRFCPVDEASWASTQKELPNVFVTPNRFGCRMDGLTPAEVEQVRGGQWPLSILQKQVTQLVLHFDELGLSREWSETACTDLARQQFAPSMTRTLASCSSFSPPLSFFQFPRSSG